MTYDEVTLFRSFMRGKGILNNFEYLYDHHKFTKKTIDVYYDDIPAEDVILNAFDFSKNLNSIYNFSYWKSINGKWMNKLSEFRSTGKMGDPTSFVCTQCKRTLPESAFAYKSNGLRHKHCMECESGLYARKKKEERLQRSQNEKEVMGILQEKTTKVCGHCGKRKPLDAFFPDTDSPDGKQDWCRECQEELASVSDAHDNSADVVDDELSLLPDGKDYFYAPRLGDYDATLHLYRNGRNYIVFNATLSNQLFAGDFSKCYINNDRQNRIFLIFNHKDGYNVTRRKLKNALAVVNSVDICRLLADKFKLDYEETYYLHISKNLASKADIITIEVLHARSRQEYSAIALRRENNISKGHVKPAESDSPVPSPDQIPVVPSTSKKVKESASDILQHLIDDGMLSERDLAAFLFSKGWKLQQAVTIYEEFNV